MVNFNNETTVTRPRQDVINFIILQRRQDCIDKLRDYTQTTLQTDNDNPASEAEFRSHLYALAIEVADMLRKETPKARDNNKNQIYNNADEIFESILLGDKADLMKAFTFVNALLYSKGLTKSDIKDVTDPEAELYDELQGDE